MNTHLQQEATSLATCWRITRTDGQEFFFTDHDTDIVFETNTYKAESGYRRTAIQNDATMAVDNLDIEGVFDSEEITEEDLRAGLFDYAEIRIFIVNWQDLSLGDIKMRKGRLGEVTLTEQGIFRAELRGLTQALSQRIGEVFQPECRADLGDSRCKVPIQPSLRANDTAYAVGDFIRVPTGDSLISSAIKLQIPADANADGIGPNAATATLGSQAQVQGTVTRFGAGAIELSPSGPINPSEAFVSYPDSDIYDLGNRNFTIEGWFRFKDLTSTLQVFASHYLSSGAERAWFIRRSGGNLQATFYDDGTNTLVTLESSVTWAIDTWYHIAVTRNGSDWRLFLDGQLLVSAINVGSVHSSVGGLLHLGKIRDVTGDQPFDGFIDDFRFTVGFARYLTNFTVPSAAFPIVDPQTNQSAYQNRIYECTVAGTTASTQPVFNTTVGGSTVDGSATFVAREAWTRNAFVEEVTDRKTFTLNEVTFEDARAVDTWFNGGALTFETGRNAGKTIEVRGWVQSTRTLTLFLPTGFAVQPGDAVRVYPGCNKLLATCRTKFAIPGSTNFQTGVGNVENFRGEPFIPGQDELTRYPDAQSG